MNAPTISLAVITKNEAENIERMISSASFVDEIVVVDSGSTDNTQQLCREMGAVVIEQEWLGFADQKQFAFEQCTSDWILSLDGDEALSPALGAEIQQAVALCNDTVCAFSMPRLSFYLGQWIHHGGWYPDRKIRLVRRSKGRWQGDGLHEKLVVEGEVKPLSNDILHWVYKDISHQIKTIDSYSTTHANHAGKRGVFYLIWGLFHMVGKFFECYIWKRGLLDGSAGLVIAVNSTWYTFLKHAKIWEKDRQHG
nr:glycosyltransferase family 2 protein [uncultured Desulfobacter sp.]